MPGCIVSATTASFISVENRRRRATPVITSTFENVSDIGTCLGLSLGPPAKAGVRSKRGAVQSIYPAGDRNSAASGSDAELVRGEGAQKSDTRAARARRRAEHPPHLCW